jgi:predicted  nucleic acid-binding Zn-ribbon protein
MHTVCSNGFSMRNILFTLPILLALTGCQSAYYSAMEKVGVHKRDILVDRVEEAQESQQDAQKQFKSALEQFSDLIKFDGGDLQRMYAATDSEYQACSAAAEDVSQRINSIEAVAEALFDEWQNELDQYTNARLKQDSKKKLADTRRQYSSLLKTMRRAEQSMQPVLASLRDNSLYLKHNLNAKAIGALQGEFNTVQKDINRLIDDMNNAITQSEQFVAALKQ